MALRYLKTFSRKQAGVIYSAMKRGDIEMTDEQVEEMYDLVNGGYCFDHSGCGNMGISMLKEAIDCIFKNDYMKAQTIINEF